MIPKKYSKKIREHAINILRKLDTKEISKPVLKTGLIIKVFILLQLVAALRYEVIDDSSPLVNLLFEKCSLDKRIATSCYWYTQVEIQTENIKQSKIADWYSQFNKSLIEYLKSSHPEIHQAIAKQSRFRGCMNDLSTQLLAKHKKAEPLKKAFRERLAEKDSIKDLEARPEDELRILHPTLNITTINPEKSSVFKSNTKPFLISFNSNSNEVLTSNFKRAKILSTK